MRKEFITSGAEGRGYGSLRAAGMEGWVVTEGSPDRGIGGCKTLRRQSRWYEVWGQDNAAMIGRSPEPARKLNVVRSIKTMNMQSWTTSINSNSHVVFLQCIEVH